MHDTLTDLSPVVKEQLLAILSVYVDAHLASYQQAKVFDKVRSNPADDALKLKIIKLYNQKMNLLPEKYAPEMDLAVVIDLFLDIFR